VKISISLGVTLAAAMLLSGLASAQEAKTSAQCGEEFDQCIAACNTDHADDAANRAACVPGCSGRYAACDASVAYEHVKPWVEEQAEKTRKFLDELLKKIPGTESEPGPDPQKKTPSNSI
jgi:hypothetical protein